MKRQQSNSFTVHCSKNGSHGTSLAKKDACSGEGCVLAIPSLGSILRARQSVAGVAKLGRGIRGFC